MSDEQWERACRRVYALLRQARISDRGDRLALFRWILHDPTVSSTNDLSVTDLNTISDTLAYWGRNGELEVRARMVADGQL